MTEGTGAKVITGKFFGAAVQDGVIRFMSVSQLARINPNEDGGCLRKWWFRYGPLRLPEPQSEARARGVDYHSTTDHFLKTGENVLGRETRPMKPYLPAVMEHPEIRDGLLREWGLNDKPREPGDMMHDPRGTLLYLADVPIVGYMDLVVPEPFAKTSILQDDKGNPIVVQNPEHTIEIVDNKFYADPEKYAVVSANIPNMSQMAGYGYWGLVRYEEVDYVRLSYLYARTDTKRKAMALKRSLLVPRDDLIRNWEGYFAGIVENAKSAAAETVEAKVPANLGPACEAFGGCAFKGRCAAYNSQTPITRLKASLSGGRGTMASAFAKSGASKTTTAAPPPIANGATGAVVPPPPGPKPAVPPPSQSKGVPPPPGAPVAAAAPKIAAAPPPPPPSGGAISAKDAQQEHHYIVPDGRTAKFLCMSGGKFVFIPVDENDVPSDKPLPLEGAIPVTETTLGAATAQTEDEAAAAEETAPPAAAAAPPPPPAPETARRPVGRPRKTTIIDAATGQPAAAPPPPAPAAAPAAPAAPVAARTDQPGITGDWLFINCTFPGAKDLQRYIWLAVDQLAKANNMVDIRNAPNADHPLAFGRWKGALAQLVRAEPPKGVFTIRTGGEFTEVVLEALTPLFEGRIVQPIAV